MQFVIFEIEFIQRKTKIDSNYPLLHVLDLSEQQFILMGFKQVMQKSEQKNQITKRAIS